jgi:hypothetical protein
MLDELDPLDFWRLAQTLGGAEADDPQLRTAVGRAYYAVFLIARQTTGVVDRHDAHTKVLRRLNERSLGAAGSELDQLRKLREVADYELRPELARHRGWHVNWLRASALVDRILKRFRDVGIVT